MSARVGGPGAPGCHLQVPAGPVPESTFTALSGDTSRVARPRVLFIGPIGSSHLHARRSGRRLNLNQKAPVAFVYGVVRVHCVVVRTTEMIAIHSSGVTCRQRRYLSTKRKIVLTSMRALVLWQLRRPAANRQVKSRLAASDCGVWLWR